MQLARLTFPSATVSEREVVEHEQLARPKNNLDLNVLDVQTVVPKERKLRT
jgi:hypothetical protein